MDLNRAWIYAVPIACVLGIGAAVYYFLLADDVAGAPRGAGPPELLLIADEDLRHPLEAPDVEHESGALGRFERRYGVRVRTEYGAPSEVFEQVYGGGAGDVYLTGDRALLERALEAGVVEKAHQGARRVPVILVRRGNPREIAGISDLANPELRLGIPGPEGGSLHRITAELLAANDGPVEGAGLLGTSVTELARAVEQDRVDAAIVWQNVGARYSRNTEMIAIPEGDGRIGALHAAVTARSKNPPAASQLARFLCGDASLQVFELYGFDVEGERKEGERRQP